MFILPVLKRVVAVVVVVVVVVVVSNQRIKKVITTIIKTNKKVCNKFRLVYEKYYNNLSKSK